MAAEFSRREVEPHLEEIERECRMPEGLMKRFATTGLLGICMPEEYGGSALSYQTFILAMEEVGRISPALVCSAVTTMAGLNIVLEYGSKAQQEQYLEAGIAGDIVTSMAFTEAGTGSDPKQLTTTAREENGRIVLNGVKRFITNAAYPGPMVVYAKDSDSGACSAYVIDKFCEGYSLSSPWTKIGILGSPVYDVFLDNVSIPPKNLLGEKGKGFEVLLMESARGKLGHAAAALGIIAEARNKAIRYAKEKLHRGKSISKFQTIQLKTTKLCEHYESARWMLYRAAAMADEEKQTEDFRAYAAMVKGYISDLAPECAMLAMNILGPYGAMQEYGVERLLRDAAIQPHIEVVSDVQRLIYAGNIYRE